MKTALFSLSFFLLLNLSFASDGSNNKIGFNVLGQVNEQGRYYLDEDKASFLKAIGKARGLTQLANPTKIRIRREDGDKVVIIDVDFTKIINAEEKDPKLKKDDTIYVPERLR